MTETYREYNDKLARRMGIDPAQERLERAKSALMRAARRGVPAELEDAALHFRIAESEIKP